MDHSRRANLCASSYASFVFNLHHFIRTFGDVNNPKNRENLKSHESADITYLPCPLYAHNVRSTCSFD